MPRQRNAWQRVKRALTYIVNPNRENSGSSAAARRYWSGRAACAAANMAVNRTTDVLAQARRLVTMPDPKGGAGRVPAAQRGMVHPVSLLLRFPAPGMTRFEWADLALRPLVAHGDGYARLEVLHGRAVGLIPCDLMYGPIRGRVTVADRVSNKVRTVDASTLLGMHGSGWDGRQSIDPTEELRAALKLSDSAWSQLQEAVDARYPVIAWDKELTKTPRVAETRANTIRKRLDEASAANPLMLEAGAIWHPGGISAHDTSLLEMVEAVVLEVARAWRMPPSLLWSSKGFVRELSDDSVWWAASIRPLDERINAAMSRTLLTPDELLADYRIESVSRRLGGAVPDPALVGQMVLYGLLTPSEGRELLGYPFREDGDRLYMPRGSGEPRGRSGPAEPSKTLDKPGPNRARRRGKR